jgi:pimeloyl-ACP methyl ester carboxylesterase
MGDDKMRSKSFLRKPSGWHAPIAMAAIVVLSPTGAFAVATMEHYISEVDGSNQTFGLYVPEPFDPEVPHPVVIDLHGYTERANTAFPMTSYADANGWIMVRPDGRGNTFYNGIAENDVFRVLEEVRARYLIDENRIYLHGCSMGGMGNLLLGLRYPHVFAAVSGRDGAYDYHWHHRSRYGKASDPDRIEPSREPLLQSTYALDIADNGKNLNMQILVHSGDALVSPDENARRLHARLNELGYDHSYHEYPGGHCAGGWELDTFDFLSQHTNEPAPKDVLLKANQLKNGSAYWVRIDRLQKKPAADQFATIEAKITGKQKDIVEVTAHGLVQFTLFLTPELFTVAEVSVTVNGEAVYTGPVGQITVFASLDEAGNIIGWSTEDTFPRGLCKTALIEGPIGHAYTSRFLLVVGTTSKAETSRNRQEADKLASEWNTWMHANISPVEDTSITEDDIASTNLILFGTADSNSVTQTINDLLPVRIWQDRIVAGGNEYVGENYGLYMIFPNPLNPERYVVISHGTIQGSCETEMNALPWYWPDYAVFDTSVVPSPTVTTPSWFGPPMVYLPDAWVEAGFFDQYWRLDNDEDGMDDIFEKDIIDADPDDAIAGIEDVNPDDDFDLDGQDNRTEYNAGTDPTSADSVFSVASVKPDPADANNFQVSWKTASGMTLTGTARSYYILWSDSMDGPWHEIGQLDPADLSDDGDIRTWTDRGTDPAMEGKKPGDCPCRFYKLAAYR